MRRREFIQSSVLGAGVLTRMAQGATRRANDIISLGPDKIKLSRLAQGTGTKGFRKSSNQTRQLGLQGLADLLRFDFDNGITFWDSADGYGSHPHLREALKSVPRDKVVIMTKTRARTAAEMRADLERFRQEIGTDYLDIVLLHAATQVDWPEQRKGAMCLVSILQYLPNGFIINPNDPDHFNAYLMILVVIAPVILVTLANWSVTALMDGKGKMGDIFKMICYSFFPLIIISLPLVLISNFITLDEVPFLNVMNLIGVILTGYMMFFGLVGIHEYGVFKTIMTALATIMAMGVIIFICLLFLTLIQQFISFVIAIYKEISFRFF